MASRSGFRRVVLGLDGSVNSRRAAAFVGRLRPPPGGRVICVRVIEPVRTPAMAFVPGAVRAQIAGQAAMVNRARMAAARRQVEAVAAKLQGRGWRTVVVVRSGRPLDGLLATVRATRADLLAIGAQGTGAVVHFLLGSVAEGALKRAPVDVLTVR